jgi:hypothetical protein
VTNCLTEIFFDQALERARYLDKYLIEKGKPVGPLHGVGGLLLVAVRQLVISFHCSGRGGRSTKLALSFIGPVWLRAKPADMAFCTEVWGVTCKKAVEKINIPFHYLDQPTQTLFKLFIFDS